MRRPPAMRVLLLLCGVLAGSATAAVDGECPRIIGVASTPGRPDLFKSFIGGEWRTSSSGKTLKVLSPCNETMLYEVQVPAGTCSMCAPSRVASGPWTFARDVLVRSRARLPGLRLTPRPRAGVHAGRDRRGIRGCKKGTENMEQDAPVRPCLFLPMHALFRGLSCDLYTLALRLSHPALCAGPCAHPCPAGTRTRGLPLQCLRARRQQLLRDDFCVCSTAGSEQSS